MTIPKSPFLIMQNFLSPKACEEIVDNLGYYDPDTDKEGNPIKMFRHYEPGQEQIFHTLEPLINEIFKYYNINYRGTEEMLFEWYYTGVLEKPSCENSNFVRRKWLRTKDRDVSGILFLSDYNDQPPFDSDYEVYGGKLEFPQHGFGFNPQRGTLIIYPSGPHFINASAQIQYGELYQVRLHMAATLPFLYQPVNFPGDFRSWFKHII